MKVFNRALKVSGEVRVINSVTVRVLEYDLNSKVMRATGLTVPTGAGYAKGALFIKTDAATGVKGLYENQGTVDSASFNLVGQVSDDSSTILGATGYGRLSTKTEAGAAVAIDSSYSFGEAWEARYTSSKADNSQFQGLFMEVRTSAANSSTIRGMEIKAAQEGAVAVGVLEGGNFVAVTRSTTTGNVGAMYGVSGEVTHNSDAYTGTVAEAAAVRGKFSAEDGTTYTDSSLFLGFGEAISGAAVIGSVLRAKVAGGITFTSVLDIAATADNLIAVDSTGQGGVSVSADGMNGNPESDTEAGFITIKVGATSYQIPFYPAA